MKILIDIDESTFTSCKWHINRICDLTNIEVGLIAEAVANGILLQKGHGRLIDADAFERRCMFDSNIEDMQDVICALRDYKPIIEADKSESEGKK